MCYRTEFLGGFSFNKTVEREMKSFINKFSKSERILRDPSKIQNKKAWEEYSFFGDVGKHGEYYANPGEVIREDKLDKESSIIDINKPAYDQPNKNCHWIIKYGKLVWDGNSYFYDYVEWLEYLIEHFFKKRGYVLNGKVSWSGEDKDDYGSIIVENNSVILERKSNAFKKALCEGSKAPLLVNCEECSYFYKNYCFRLTENYTTSLITKEEK